MYSFKCSGKEFEIPTSYFDLTVKEYLSIVNQETNLDWLAMKTGFTKEELIFIDLEPVLNALNFISEHPTGVIEHTNQVIINDLLFTLKKDIGEYQFGQKILAVQKLDEGDPVGALAVYLEPLVHCAKFDAERIDEVREILIEMNCGEVYGAVGFVTEWILEALKKERALPSVPISAEQTQAGINNFEELGVFNLIDDLAHGQPWRYEEVLAIDYNTIFMKLRRMNISAIFERRYSDILRAKHNRQTT